MEAKRKKPRIPAVIVSKKEKEILTATPVGMHLLPAILTARQPNANITIFVNARQEVSAFRDTVPVAARIPNVLPLRKHRSVLWEN